MSFDFNLHHVLGLQSLQWAQDVDSNLGCLTSSDLPCLAPHVIFWYNKSDNLERRIASEPKSTQYDDSGDMVRRQIHTKKGDSP